MFSFTRASVVASTDEQTLGSPSTGATTKLQYQLMSVGEPMNSSHDELVQAYMWVALKVRGVRVSG